MKGRKPKPTALHVLEGTLNTTRHAGRAQEPQCAEPMGPEPPSYLSDEQKATWRYAVEHAPANVLQRIDASALLVWVEAEDRLRRAMMAQGRLDQRSPAMPFLLKRPGSKTGELTLSPYLSVITAAGLTVLRAAAELGFTPAARPRLAPSSGGSNARPAETPWQRLRVLQGGAESA